MFTCSFLYKSSIELFMPSMSSGVINISSIRLVDCSLCDMIGGKEYWVCHLGVKKHYKEFLEDMISNINIKEDEIEVTQYFMWTMLLVGEKINYAKNLFMLLMGRQQRLTIVTILFSAVAQILKSWVIVYWLILFLIYNDKKC